VSLLQRLAALAGYELRRRDKPRDPLRQLVLALDRAGIEAVVDVGANRGQYAMALRAAGWRGPILSIEPIAELRQTLAARAAHDRLWQVLPALAIGDRDGTATLEISAESDMSSLRPQTGQLRELSPSSAIVERREVPVRRLDLLPELTQSSWRRIFVKIDVQGAEWQVLDGARGLDKRLIGLQLEMALVPLYVGEADWRSTVDRLAAAGYDLYLLIPGYFERKLVRQMQVDGIFFRPFQGLPMRERDA
jgi:FkbM family methyltransferase